MINEMIEQEIDYCKTKLANIALELLEMYRASETSLICEFEGFDEVRELTKLEEECADYRKEIRKLVGWTVPSEFV